MREQLEQEKKARETLQEYYRKLLKLEYAERHNTRKPREGYFAPLGETYIIPAVLSEPSCCSGTTIQGGPHGQPYSSRAAVAG